MQIDLEKKQRQLEGVDAWENNNYQGVFAYHTGTGKTFAAFLAIERIKKLGLIPITVLVPSVPLEEQWRAKMINHFPKVLMNRVIIKTAQTIISEGFEYHTGLLIVDELHEFSTDERIKLIDNTIIKKQFFLGLTASEDDKNYWKIKRLHQTVDRITEQEAIEKGYVSEYVEYNLGLTLSKAEKERYDKLTEVISLYMPRFNNDIQLANKVVFGGKDKQGNFWSGGKWALGIAYKNGWRNDLNLSFSSHKELDRLHNPSNYINYAKALTNCVRQRKTLLCTCISKIEATVELVLKFNKVKSIVFSESTEFADKVHEILNNKKHPTVVHHSQLKTIIAPSEKTGKPIKYGKARLQKLAIQKITNGEARTITVGTSVDRGLDVPDLRFSITASGTQSVTQYKQRNGRVGRKEENIDTPVLIVNLYIIDTQDELWLKSRQSHASYKPIIVKSIEEITYYPTPNKEFTLNDI